MKFEVSGKVSRMLGGIIPDIELKLKYDKPTDVPIKWCDGCVKYAKKRIIHIHHGDVEVVSNE